VYELPETLYLLYDPNFYLGGHTLFGGPGPPVSPCLHPCVWVKSLLYLDQHGAVSFTFVGMILQYLTRRDESEPFETRRDFHETRQQI